MKDGYTLYALKMVYGGFGAFVMVNFTSFIPRALLALTVRDQNS